MKKLIGRLLLWGVVEVLAIFLYGFFEFVMEVSSREETPFPSIPETMASLMKSGKWDEALNELLSLPDQYDENPDINYYIAR